MTKMTGIFLSRPPGWGFGDGGAFSGFDRRELELRGLRKCMRGERRGAREGRETLSNVWDVC